MKIVVDELRPLLEGIACVTLLIDIKDILAESPRYF